MRVGRIKTGDGARLAVERAGEWSALDDYADMRRLICDGVEEVLERATTTPVDSVDVSFTAPLRPGKIVAIGLNYLDHIRESGVQPPASPLVFAKFPSSVIGPREPIVLNPAVSKRVDWEGELAVVVGRTLRCANRSEALDAVFGYTIANDVSARDVQFADGQWIRGKNLDTFCPLGPFVVTADEVPDPQMLQLTTKVNDETVQNASTAEMIFPVAELLAFCSQSFTFEPGDVLLSGTPWGCGEFMQPQRSLAAGDSVEVTISQIGTLTNPVLHPKEV